jgi:hypothetical protein
MNDFYFSKCFSLIGFLMIWIAIGLYFASDYMLKFQVNKVNRFIIIYYLKPLFVYKFFYWCWKIVILKNNSAAFEIWRHPPAKMLRKYFVFDVINPAQIESGTAKPKVIQRGPYVYSKYIIKWFFNKKR